MSQNLFSAVMLFDAVLLDIGVKSLLLLTVTFVGAFLLRKRSAATVHRWWVLGFGGCIVIPLIALIAPSWTLPILPDTFQAIQSPANDHSATLANQEMLTDFGATTSPPSLLRSHERPQLPVDARIETDVHDAGVASVSQLVQTEQSFEFSWAKTNLTIWFVGVLVCLVRKSWQHLTLQRLLKRCTKIDSEAWINAVAEASQSLGLQQSVSLLRLHEAQSPLTAGLLRPVVVLPGDAEEWQPARRRLVLLHELAHVKRRDVLTQTAAGLVSAFYWFNPFCWVGLVQMRKLRELACDDLVLSCGQQPADYADVLLDVARSYRHRNFSTAVGMAHSSNVESRILAILDKARSRVSLTRRAALLLLASATTLVLLIGSARLESQAEPLAADDVAETTPAKTKTDTDDDFRTMEVRVTDEEGESLNGVRLQVSMSSLEPIKGKRIWNPIHHSNADGKVIFKTPRRLDLLRFWPSKPGYVAEFVNFSKGTHGNGIVIPDHYEFQLERGAELSGTVVDEKGKPVSSVKVRFKVEVEEPRWGVDPQPMISTWIMGNSITDKEGRWSTQNAPARQGPKDFEFRLKFTHDDYTSDSEWGGLQREQKVTTADLRTGDATIVMFRGTHVRGTVVDSEGNPVKKGWVVWHDMPYFTQGVWEAGLDKQGGFETPQLDPGEYPITIVAPGYAAQRRVVKVEPGMKPLRFDLNPGKRIEIHFVDTAGNPVPRTGVWLANTSSPNTWNGSNALHNHKHSNVPEYGISRRADENGVYIWNWAPEEPVRYSVGAKGFAPQKVSLVAKSEPHIITLAEARVVAGLVTDEKTGEPIKKFQIMPVIIFRPNFFSTRYEDVKQGVDGRYELPLTGSGDSDDRYRVRIEAEGYRSIVSEESYGPQDGRVELNIRLEPAPARKGRVVDADGKPISGAAVIEGTSTWVPSTSNGKLDSYGERIVQTDSDGRFMLNATTEPIRVRVLHDDGICEKFVDPENDVIGDLQVQPWARVSGRLLQEGKPIADETISFYPVLKGHLGEPRFQDSYYVKTDVDGRFEFERLPPIAGSLKARLGPWQESPLTSSHTLALDLKPGEHQKVSLGGEGIAVTGKVVATGRGDAELNKQWSLNYLISRDRGIALPAGFPKLGFDPTGPVESAWFLDPKRYDWLATRENYFVKLQPDGQLHISGVPAGTYDLVLRLYEQPAGCLVETIGEKVVTVKVAASDQAAGTKDLGVIEVACRAGPRVGESMRIYSFTDTSGRQRTIHDMKGRYVLMHVWASWCAPCLEVMPDVRATVEALADQPITFVGLNIDKEADRAKALVQRGGWDWSQNYLGDASDMARQLAISSAPTYFLVGPDGLLVASSNQWTEIKTALNSALNEVRD